MKVQVLLLDRRVSAWGFPHYGSGGAAGLDLHACLDAPLRLDPGGPATLISSGVAIHIDDPDWCGLVTPRSGLGHRGLVLGNAVGVIDSDYTGACLISAWNRNPMGADGDAGTITIQPGERIAQLLFVRIARPDFEIVEALAGAEPQARGAGGFGSTGLAPRSGAVPGSRLPP